MSIKLPLFTLDQIVQESTPGVNFTVELHLDNKYSPYPFKPTAWKDIDDADEFFSPRGHAHISRNLQIVRHNTRGISNTAPIYEVFKHALYYHIQQGTGDPYNEINLMFALEDLFSYGYIMGKRAERSHRRNRKETKE